MPNRILREGILTSERIEQLGWAEEVFYRRLMSVVDDFGRYYARPSLLLAACYPLLLQKVSDSDIEKWLTACVNAALVRVYSAQDGKRYLMLLDFNQQVRATKSKYPPPPSDCAADATQMLSTGAASAHLGGVVCGVGDEDGGGGAAASHPPAVDNSKPPPMPSEFQEVLNSRPDLTPDTVWQNFWEHYPEPKRTLARWKKWVEREFPGKPAGNVVSLTTPGPKGPDPALAKLARDALVTKPMPPEIEEEIRKKRALWTSEKGAANAAK